MSIIFKLLVMASAVISYVLLTSLSWRLSPHTAQADTMELNGLHRVLDPPILRDRRILQDHDGRSWVEFDLEWLSRWGGGAVDLQGTLFIEHRELPAGRVLACRLDPAKLAVDSGFTARIPVIPRDGSSHVLCEASLEELTVYFRPRP